MTSLAKLTIGIAAAALTALGQSNFSITSNSQLPAAVIGEPYAPVILQVTPDPGPVTWTFAAGAPTPIGFTVAATPQSNTTGTFCYGSPCQTIGVQTAPGTYTFIITASSQSTNQSASRQFTLVVAEPLLITTTTLPNFTGGQPYSARIAAAGGTGQYSWSLVESNLPPGIVLDPATGILSGIAPAGNNVYTFTIQVLDQAAQLSATQTFTIGPGLAILTTSLPVATLNQPYSFQLQGAGGSSPIWTLLKASQPPPLFTLSSSGLLSGFSLVPGKFSLNIQLADEEVPGTATQTFPFFITLGPLGIEELTLPGATQNVPYSTTLTPFGGLPPYTWSFGTATPAGLSIDASTGTISGTPPNSGLFDVPVTLTDSTGSVFPRTYSLSVARAVSITTLTLPNGPPGVSYSTTLIAAGGSLPFSWTVSAGSLPTGLTLGVSSGIINGTPTTPGAFQFTIKVTDFFGGTATRIFTIVIGAIQPLVITTTSLPDSSLNETYTPQILAATGGVSPYTWSIVGTLPPGLQLGATTGVVGGTPTTVGFFPFEVVVTDTQQNVARKSLSINSTDPANRVVVSDVGFTGFVLTAFSKTLTATGGTPPYTWSISSGTLPTGLALAIATGIISGTPGAAGVSGVTVTATDANGQRSTPASVSFNITLPPTPATSITLGPATQATVSLSTDTPYPVEITGFLTLTFASSVGGTDDLVRFSNGSRSLEYILRANTTQAIFPTAGANPVIVTGTVAGTITVRASLSASGQDITPSTPPTRTITIDPAVPVITSVVLQQVTGGLSVVVTGYSNTREVSSGSFTFTVSGSTISPIAVTLTSAYSAWFSATASNATGGQFKLTVPFTVTGNTAAITRVSVTLTNSRGTSAALSSP